MTRQQIFTKVKNHLIKQGSRSMTSAGGACAYRGADNKSCAVGCLIPDKLYNPDMEFKTVWELSESFPKILYACGISISATNLDFLTDLQIVHDSTNPEAWEMELKDFAKQRGLKY